MNKLFTLINHRDFILSLALITGLVFGERTQFLADISIYSLAGVMIFATTGFDFRSWLPVKSIVKPLFWSLIVNFVLFGTVLLVLSYLFFSSDAYYAYFIGFVLLAAAPPGPSVVPFSAMLKGDTNYSITGVFGLHFIAMGLTPLILLIFLGQSLVNPFSIFKIMLQLIIIPLIVSRFLRHPKLLPTVEKVRETGVKWGLYLVITPIMGMSSSLILSQPTIVVKMIIVLALAYGVGIVYHLLMKKLGVKKETIISSTLMLTTKGSAFAAVTAFTFFSYEPMVALPAAIASVFVAAFIVLYSAFVKYLDKG